MINNQKQGLIVSVLLISTGLASTANAQQWPQNEQAYIPSTQSPQWVDSNRMQRPQTAPNGAMTNPPQAPYQGNMPYQQRYPQQYQQRYYPPQQQGYMPYPQAQGFYPPSRPSRGSTGWGSWPNMNSNSWMPGFNMGNWSMPDMDMGNWSTPNMDNFNNMPGMPNMDNFSMPSPSFDMPSPSFTTPPMRMPFNY